MLPDFFVLNNLKIDQAQVILRGFVFLMLVVLAFLQPLACRQSLYTKVKKLLNFGMTCAV